MIDDKDKIIVGNTIPEWTYSFGLQVGWKGLSLEAQFQGVGDVYTYPIGQPCRPVQQRRGRYVGVGHRLPGPKAIPMQNSRC